MKTLRMSRSTENRNARKVIAFRGGAPGAGLPQGQMLVGGRRLRRAIKSRNPKLQAYLVDNDRGIGLPLPANDDEALTRAILARLMG